ncbi:MAG: hypothetical protein K6G52_06140, partial [Treponemataceae bacterium]|nr:hypothetical protein [Treponemataceae bacterium]
MKKTFSALVLVVLMASVLFCEELFTGDGRKDLRIQVENPELKNIGTESEWLPEFIVNTISDDIAKYSNIQIVDIYNSQKIAATQRRDENLLFDENEATQIGNFAVAKNVLLVSITGKSTSYAISVRINDKEKNISIAAHNNANCTFADLESGKAIKEAVADLLSQLNVQLTQAGKKSLLSIGTAKANASLEAQKLVAQGNIAAQKGSNIEALSYYIQAASADSSLERALKSMSSSSKVIAAGDFGARARNMIQAREDFKKLIDDTKAYFGKNYPYYIVYDPKPKMGNVDYANRKFDYDIKASVVMDLEKQRLYDNIIAAYNAQPDSANWNLDKFFFPEGFVLSATFKIKDKNGQVLGTTEKHFRCQSMSLRFCETEIVQVPVSADSDASDIIIEVSDTCTYYEKNMYNNKETYTPVNINSVAIDDYVFKIFARNFAFEEVIPGVSVLTLPNGKSQRGCNNFFKDFGYGSDFVEKMADKIMNQQELKAYKSKDLAVTYNERKVFEFYSPDSGHKKITKSGKWVVLDDCFVLNDNPTSWPRDKKIFLSDFPRYMPIRWAEINIPECDYMYGVFPDVNGGLLLNEILACLSHTLSIEDGQDGRYVVVFQPNRNYSYCRVPMFKFEDFARNEERRVEALGFSGNRKVSDVFKSVGLELVPYDNRDRSDLHYDDAVRFELHYYDGVRCDSLRDFTYIIQEKPEFSTILLPICAIKPQIAINKNISQLQAFNNSFQITSEPVSEELISTVKKYCSIVHLNYDFPEKYDTDYEKAVLVNAINELSGYQPVAKNADQDFARSVSEIDVFPCDTDGFSNLTQSELDENP